MNRKILSCCLLLCCSLLVCCLSGCAGKTAQTSGNVLDTAREAALQEKPIDFSELEKLNPDICGWLVIPGMELSEPVLRHPEDDTWYAGHAPDGSENAGGSVYCQATYNTADFTDPVTVLYGSELTPGRQFSNLMKLYSEDGSLQRAGEIRICTPAGMLRYQAFGAGLYNSTHIIHDHNGFQKPDELEAFLKAFRQYHSMSRQYDDGITLTDSDRVLILSTHVPRNEDLRYLVVAKLVGQTG